MLTQKKYNTMMVIIGAIFTIIIIFTLLERFFQRFWMVVMVVAIIAIIDRSGIFKTRTDKSPDNQNQ